MFNKRTSTNWYIKFRSSDITNADLYYCCAVVQWRCERWFRGSVETGRVYSWYLSAVSTQLHFHHKLWGTTARWGLIAYQLHKLCYISEQNFADRHFEKTCCELLHQTREFYLELYCFTAWDVNKCWTCEIQNVGSQLCIFVVFPCVFFQSNLKVVKFYKIKLKFMNS